MSAPSDIEKLIITPHVIQTRCNLPNADSGGTAEVYRGTYTHPDDLTTIEVVIKVIRTEQQESLHRKKQKNLVRELTVWNALRLTPHDNILQLFGVVHSPSSNYLASVSECCKCSLEKYFEEMPEKPQYLKLIRETLQGLAHMHSLSPPIVHGDLKLPNILLGFNGAVRLCDFGQSRFAIFDQRGIELEPSTTFQATYRYMSPELFSDRRRTTTTVQSDVWAYGCVALQILSRLKPYHTIKSDTFLPKLILGGLAPSSRPERPYSPSCLNEPLWNIIKSCWSSKSYRPSSSQLLAELNYLLDNKLVDSSTVTPDRMSLNFDGELPEWPDGVEDFGSEDNAKRDLIRSSNRADIYILNLSDQGTIENREVKITSDTSPAYIIKVPKPASRDETNPDTFMHLLRAVLRQRYSLQHKNIVEMIGVDTYFKKYPGTVFERCEKCLLDLNFETNPHKQVRYLMHILEGLRYLHTFPTPIAHGDLNPSNILIDATGTLKLTLYSLSWLAADMPTVSEPEPLGRRFETVRYLSPEMLDPQARPSISADMWAFGCVVFWLCSGFAPYHQIQDEERVESKILLGVSPYSSRSLLFPDEIFKQSTKNTWLTNGVSDWAEKCWKRTEQPNASDILRVLKELPTGPDEEDHNWSRGVTNLSGSVTRSSSSVMLGGTSGIWRRQHPTSFKPSQDITYVTLRWAKSTFRRGFFRIETEMMVKFSSHRDSQNGSAAFLAAQQSMKHELRILVQLQHANICFLWGYEEDAFGQLRMPAIVTEFCSNGTLKEYLANHAKELNKQKRIKLMENILSGVDYLHDKVTAGPIVHGNLNTCSIVVDKNGTPKIRNFEFSHQYARHHRSDALSEVVHVPSLATKPSRWHPPEMFVTDRTTLWPLVTTFTDLWAVGCLLIAIMSGFEPYVGTNIPAVFTRIAKGEVPYSRGACSDGDVWSLAERLWDAKPMGRISAKRALQIIRLYT